MEQLNSNLGAVAEGSQANFHGDELLGDRQIVYTGTLLDPPCLHMGQRQANMGVSMEEGHWVEIGCKPIAM